jgi:pimeloyl-ACP methyl ester carboxylesterase
MSRTFRRIAISSTIAVAFTVATPVWASAKNVVLVHGMGMDGSTWRPVYDILKAKGFNVSIVQQPLDGFDRDVQATQRVIDRQKGPVVLVGHSYGGVVITTAGNDPKVKALVYLAAIQPDKGETMGSLNAKLPSAFDPKGSVVSADGFTSVTVEAFVRDVAQDLPKATAEFLVASQTSTTTSVFSAPTLDPAWRHKPAFGVVATRDRTVNPDLERWMYKRSATQITEVDSGHMVYMSHPQAVADVIIRAANAVD